MQACLGDPTFRLPALVLVPAEPYTRAGRLRRGVFASLGGARVCVVGAPTGRTATEPEAFWASWLASLGEQQEQLRGVIGPGVQHLARLVSRPAIAIGVIDDPAHVALSALVAAMGRPESVLDASGGMRAAALNAFSALAEGRGVRGLAAEDATGLFNAQSRAILASGHDVGHLPLTVGPPADADAWRRRLRDVVNRHYTLGPQEHLEGFAVFLRRKFAWYRPDMTTAELRRGSMAAAFSPDVVELVEQCNWLDVELHRELVSRFRPAGHRGRRPSGSGQTTVYIADRPPPHPPLVFHHIRKTAGTTLRALMQQNLEAVPRRDVLPAADDHGSAELWFGAWLERLGPGERERIVGIAGHGAADALRWLPSADALCLLRDPVERAISRWWFTGDRKGDRPADPERFMSWPLEEILERLEGGMPRHSRQHEKAAQFFNGQARAVMQPFCDTGTFAFSKGPGADAELWRERAFAALERFQLVGATERFDQLAAHLAARYGWQTTSVRSHKRNPNRPRGTAVPDELRALVREYNWLDVELHQRALARWPPAEASVGGS